MNMVCRYGPDSIFRGTLIPDDMRLRTGWGEHSTTEVGLFPSLAGPRVVRHTEEHAGVSVLLQGPCGCVPNRSALV